MKTKLKKFGGMYYFGHPAVLYRAAKKPWDSSRQYYAYLQGLNLVTRVGSETPYINSYLCGEEICRSNITRTLIYGRSITILIGIPRPHLPVTLAN